MKQSVKLILLVVLFCAYCIKAQEEDVTDPDTDADTTSVLDGTNQLDTKRAGRMNGGTTALIGDYPYVVEVIITLPIVTMFQLGVIISDTNVLTSGYSLTMALMIQADPPPLVQIRAGSNYPEKEGFLFETTGFKIHDQYSRLSEEYNVAVVTINGSFSGYANVKPIAVESTLIDVSKPGIPDCITIGSGSVAPYPLVRSILKLISNDNCPGGPFVSLQCAIAMGGNACGDLGGPVVCSDRLYGLVGYTCSPMAAPFVNMAAASINTFVAPFLPQPKKIFKCPCNSC